MIDITTPPSGSTLNFVEFAAAIGLCLFWGFGWAALLSNLTRKIDVTLGLIIAYFVFAFGGIYLALSSDSILWSFVGYNLVVLPVGVILGPILDQYEEGAVKNALELTSYTSISMVFWAMMFPQIFAWMGGMLFCGLSALIIVGVYYAMIGRREPKIMAYIGVVVFSCYIGYDLQLAMKNAWTINNATDSSISLLLDIINLLIEILAATAES